LDKGFSFANPDFIHHYLKSNVGILVDFRIRGINEEFLALFKKRDHGHNPVIRNMSLALVNSCSSPMLSNIEFCHRDCKCQQQPMLVSNVEFMETREGARRIPSVWLDTKDVVLGFLSHSLYLSSDSGLISIGLRSIFDNRKFCAVGDCASVSQNQSARQVIQSTSEIVEDVPSTQCKVAGNFRHLRRVVDALSRLRVALYCNRIGLRPDGIQRGLQVFDVLVGPPDF